MAQQPFNYKDDYAMIKKLQNDVKNMLSDHPELGRDIAFLVVTLKHHKFIISRAGQGYSYVKPADVWQQENGPFVMIDSQEYRPAIRLELQRTPEGKAHDELLATCTLANLRERQRLLKLLDEFYTTRTPLFYTRLIIEGLGTGGSMLTCQGTGIMALPERETASKKWLMEARAEMLRFAEFLQGKLSVNENQESN